LVYHLKPEYDEELSNRGVDFNIRRYSKATERITALEGELAAAAAAAAQAEVGLPVPDCPSTIFQYTFPSHRADARYLFSYTRGVIPATRNLASWLRTTHIQFRSRIDNHISLRFAKTDQLSHLMTWHSLVRRP
jgi:hypothetical protein